MQLESNVSTPISRAQDTMRQTLQLLGLGHRT